MKYNSNKKIYFVILKNNSKDLIRKEIGASKVSKILLLQQKIRH